MRKLSNDEFISKVKEIHGDKYDLSKINFNGYNNNVIVICKKHGEFEISPGNLLNGRGCKTCSNEKKSKKMSFSKDLFLEKAKKVHGDKYDYSKVEYINCDTPVCIICPEHGEFWQTPYVHLKGHGCKQCASEKNGKKLSLSKEEFIERANKIHGDKYNYSKIVYKNIDKKVCIICPEHGEFWQTPYVHLKGHGCKKCANEKNSCLKIGNKEKFIKKSKQVHGDKYDYSKVEYHKMHDKVCIICPEHGEFWQTPTNHTSGCGCPKCGDIERAFKKKLTTEQFVEKAKQVHGDKYNYSKVNYIDAYTKVCIMCPNHGEFWQTPDGHSHGHGCPHCTESHLERAVRLFLEEKSIKYEYRKKDFKWLNGLELDFFLPDYNIAIECQGEQHFEPVDFAGMGKEWALKKHLDVVKRDNIKNELCNENNITLYYFSNKKFVENVIVDVNEFERVIKMEKEFSKKS